MGPEATSGINELLNILKVITSQRRCSRTGIPVFHMFMDRNLRLPSIQVLLKVLIVLHHKSHRPTNHLLNFVTVIEAETAWRTRPTAEQNIEM
jgi:hypothetical protein